MADNPLSAPGQPPAPPATPETPAAAMVVVKKYANRRLYNTETSSYITLDNLAEMIRAGRDFVVYDAKTGDDITRGVLTQIIVDEENKGSAMLPTAFLRQLIGLYGGNLQGVVPRYLEQAMSNFGRQQQQMRTVMERTLSPFLPSGVEEMSRQNIAMFERAISMWNPFHRPSEPEEDVQEHVPAPTTDGETDQVAQLRSEIENLQRQLAAAHAAAIPATIEPFVPPHPSVPHPNVPANAPFNVLSDPPSPVVPVLSSVISPAVMNSVAARPLRRTGRGKTAETVSSSATASMPGERGDTEQGNARDPEKPAS